MGWFSRLLASRQAESVNPGDETVINAAPYHPQMSIRSSARNSADRAEADSLDEQNAEEIKRRQISLAVRYVAAVRARAR